MEIFKKLYKENLKLIQIYLDKENWKYITKFENFLTFLLKTDEKLWKF